MATGICKFTNKTGEFVRCHILPLKLTRHKFFAEAGLPQVAIGRAHPGPTHNYGGWYDEKLVIDAGEQFFKKLDTFAIAELRKHKLVWSGWGDSAFAVTSGIRILTGADVKKLRLFFFKHSVARGCDIDP
jgi:hypothetical protein